MKNYNEIRKLFIKDNINKAIAMLMEIIPQSAQDECILLSNQYKNWEKNHFMGFKPPLEVRNKIVYGFLTLISNLEKESSSGLKKYHLEMINKFENDLYNGCYLLEKIKTAELTADDIVEKLLRFSGNSLIDFQQKDSQFSTKELEVLIEKKLIKYEKIYTLLVINSFLMIIIILAMPFVTSGSNLFDEIMKDGNIEEEDSDDNSDLELD